MRIAAVHANGHRTFAKLTSTVPVVAECVGRVARATLIPKQLLLIGIARRLQIIARRVKFCPPVLRMGT